MREGEKEKEKAKGRRKENSRRLGVRVVIMEYTYTLADIKRGRCRYKEPVGALGFIRDAQLEETRGSRGENESKAGRKSMGSG